MTTEYVAFGLIKIDHDTQSRAATNEETVIEYAERLRDGAEFPPVDLFTDGDVYHVGDGIHRILARKRLEQVAVRANVHKGGKREAAIFACGANKTHGLKRTNADKRKCVERMIRLEPEWADNRIAEHVGVSHPFVGKVRGELETVTSSPAPATRVGSDGKRRKAPAPKPARKAVSAPEAKATTNSTPRGPNFTEGMCSAASCKAAAKCLKQLAASLNTMGVLELYRTQIDEIENGIEAARPKRTRK